MRSLCLGSYRYIFNGDGTEEVYRFIYDPLEFHDIVASPEGKEIAVDCRALRNK